MREDPVSKLFELCLIDKLHGKFLKSSYVQFGLCPNQASLMHFCLRSVLKYFNYNGSTVTPFALDISTACDETNHCALYFDFIKKNTDIDYASPN